MEAQKDEPTRYQILNRAVFYVSRLISSQKERDFEKTNYNDIKKVYSIWGCMNMDENTMSHIHLTQDDLVGSYKWKGNLDLINIVMIGLGKNLPEHDDMYELHRLLGTLLSNELSSDEKLDIIGNEYDIPIEEKFIIYGWHVDPSISDPDNAITYLEKALDIAEHGLVMTLGELGHRRWKRLDFISKHYSNIKTIEDVTVENFVEEIIKIGKLKGKNLKVVYFKDWNNIGRVWFEIVK